jgi:hypothetical protein
LLTDRSLSKTCSFLLRLACIEQTYLSSPEQPTRRSGICTTRVADCVSLAHVSLCDRHLPSCWGLQVSFICKSLRLPLRKKGRGSGFASFLDGLTVLKIGNTKPLLLVNIYFTLASF